MNDTVASTAPAEGRVRALLVQPIGRPTLAVTIALALWTVWGFSLPGGPSMGTYASMALTGLAIGCYWFIRLLICSGLGGLRKILDAWPRWVAPPVVALVAAGLVATSVPFLVRFNLSRDDMDQLVREAGSGASVEGADRVGLFPVKRVETFEDGIRFIVNDCMSDTCGFAYTATGRPPNLGGEDTYHHIDGGWFVWEQSW